MTKHYCHEDNQGYCHNGCGKIMNTESANNYHGDKGYIRALELRMWHLEKLLADKKGDK